MKNWETILAEGCRTLESLSDYLHYSPTEMETLNVVQENFPVFVNPYYLSLINKDNPEDPIRKMCIPNANELSRTGSFDPSDEYSNTILPGLQHKYRETALILSTNQCAMYCRHCFRKRLVGLSEKEICAHIEEIASYIMAHREINNVLITGGDAFMNSNNTIAQYLAALSQIPHIDFIRFGTRTPVVLPQRIITDQELISILRNYSGNKQLYVITQFNHPSEITSEAAAAVSTLITNGIPVRNQTVLLKGVNDNCSILGFLMQELTAIGVLPYYIFQCRPVKGVMNHFQVPLRTGHSIVQNVMNRQNGMGKSFRYILSHSEGKIEILSSLDEHLMLFKYHEAKDPSNVGKVFAKRIDDDQCWL